MKLTEPKFKLGERVFCRDKVIRGHNVRKRAIGQIVSVPLTINGDFVGHYYVKIPGVPGTAVVAEGLLYQPRKRKHVD